MAQKMAVRKVLHWVRQKGWQMVGQRARWMGQKLEKRRGAKLDRRTVTQWVQCWEVMMGPLLADLMVP